MADEIKIGTFIDLGPLRAGMQSAVSITETNLAIMKQQYQKATADAKVAIRQLTDSHASLGPAAKAGSTVAIEALKIYEAEVQRTVGIQVVLRNQIEGLKAALKEEAGAADAAAKAAAENAAALEAEGEAAAKAAAQIVAASEAEEAAAARAEARMASMATRIGFKDIGLQAGMAGRAVGSLIGQSETLAPILSAAFPAFIVVAFGEALIRVIPKIKEFFANLNGSGQWKEAIREYTERTAKLRIELIQVQAAHHKAEEIGTEGMRKVGLATRAATSDATAYHKALYGDKESNLEGEVKKLQRLTDHLEKFKAAASDAFTAFKEGTSGELPFFQTKEEVQKAEEAVKKQEAIVDGLTSHKMAADREVENARREAGVESQREERELAGARQESLHKLAQAGLSATEDKIKRDRAAEDITDEEERERMIQLTAAKIAEERRYYAAKRDLARNEEKQTGKSAAPKLQEIGTEEITGRLKLQQQLADFIFKSTEDEQDKSRQLSLAKISDAEAVANAQIALAEKTATIAFEEHRISAKKETELLIAQEAERYKATQTAIDARRAIYEADSNKYKKEIVALQKEVETEEATHQTKLAELRHKGLTEQQAELQTQQGLVRQEADAELKVRTDADNDLLSHARITSRTWARDMIAATDDWAAKQKATLQAELNFSRENFGEESNAYRAAAAKMVAIEEERARKVREIRQKEMADLRRDLHEITDEVLQGVNQWISGQKKFGAAMKQVWNSIALDVIKDIEKIGQKHLEELIIREVQEKLFHVKKKVADTTAETTRTAQHSAANAAILASDATLAGSQTALATTTSATMASLSAVRVGTHNASNVVMATSDAFLAAAAAFASVMEALPFPANVAAAPPVAATTLATGLAFAGAASAAQGGIVPINAHAGEMILPAHISSWVQKAAQGGSPGGGQTINVNHSPTINHNMTRADIDRHSDYLYSSVKSKMGRFNR